MVDTGSPDFIHMSSATAERLGIVESIGQTPQRRLPLGEKAMSKSSEYRVAKSLRVGDNYFENVLVRVDTSDTFTPTVLGIGFLSYAKSVRFGSKGITFNSEVNDEYCKVPFRFRSSPYISVSVAPINVKIAGAELSSRQTVLLTKSQNLPVQLLLGAPNKQITTISLNYSSGMLCFSPPAR